MEENKIQKILQMIKNDEPQQNHFFKKLASSSNPIPWLRILKDNGYFDPHKNPPPQELPDKKGYFIIPQWNVLGFLENVATKNVEIKSDEITDLLLETTNSIINYRDSTGARIENYWTDWALIKIIFILPTEKINIEHVEFIRTALKSKWNTTLIPAEIGKTVFPKLIGDKTEELLLKLLDVIFDYRKTAKVITQEFVSVMDEYWLNDALKKYKPEIAKICSVSATSIALNKIRAIIKEDPSQFNFVWIPTIENHPQTNFTEKYECQLVYFVRDLFKLSSPEQIKEEVNLLLKEEHPIFKRIALHTINHHYQDLKNIFWSWQVNPLNEHLPKHELYELLKLNCLSFDEKQIDRVLEWIESKDYYIRGEFRDDEEKRTMIIAINKKEWLSSLLETKNTKVKDSYEKYHKINPTKIEHPGFDIWTESGWGTTSPIEPTELLQKSNSEIAEYLNRFKDEGFGKQPSKEGLAEAFRNCVTRNPECFSVDLEPFLKIHRMYQHSLLWGLMDAWRAKKNFPWKSLLEFTFKIVNSKEFWDEKYDEGYNYRNWITSEIAGLIEDGTKDDSHAFEPNLLPKAEEILLILAKNTESDLSEIHDLVTSVLNSAKGKVFSAMVDYSLRIARLAKISQGDRWIEKIKTDFDKRLNREFEPSLEFSLILGEYLANFLYLDEKWVIDNLNRIFPKDNATHWQAAFTGYLFYTIRVHKTIYFLLKENNHYAKAIETDFPDSHITERFVQHICIGYLEDWEGIDDKDSLICKLIEKRNVNQLLEIVSFFWMQRESPTAKIKIKEKIKPLWEILFNICSQNEKDPEYQKILSNLSKWLSLIDEIDDHVLEWLKLSAKYIQVDFNTTFFIEDLLKYASKNPAKVGQIYINMLDAGIYPDYKKEVIQEIVKVLYGQSETEIANRICIAYLEKGYDFLELIYAKYRN